MKTGSRILTRTAMSGLAALVAVFSLAPTATAAIRDSAATHYVISATRASDGTITTTARITSSDARCLTTKRLHKLRDGYYHLFDTSELLYEHATGPNPRETVGHSPVSFQAPSSPAGKSPWIWHSVIPGNAEVLVGGFTPSAHRAPVSEATGILLYGPTVPADNNQPYKIKYRQKGGKVVLTCGPLKGNPKVVVQF